ncbi:hypothetical protein DKX38_008695 [Salix brachista]|uniref:Uncharacterized protein n=1 Tax=Salix brachista TaxID=2182728 RepID=A0A5N5MTK9_9ROSI|nr:hypothetical protein DKX38_008695 [Salix brachista]
MAVPNMDVFEAYFKRADLDGDARISVRADRIQSDLDEILKVLTEQCKKHGLTVNSTAVIELPFGWQPGIQEDAATWDEDWDKFEDEGIYLCNIPLSGFSNELTVDVKSAPGQKERASADDSLTPDSLSNGDGRPGIFTSEHVLESESAYNHSVDEMARSPQGSRAGRSFDESIWGAFDTNDDVDSVWGFNPTGNKLTEEHSVQLFLLHTSLYPTCT